MCHRYTPLTDSTLSHSWPCGTDRGGWVITFVVLDIQLITLNVSAYDIQ